MDEQLDEKIALSHRAKTLATYSLPFVWAICLFVFLNVTSPLRNGPLSVLVTFVLIYLLITSTLFCVTLVILKVARFLGWHKTLPSKTVYYLVSVIALGPVFVLALNTLGQLEIKDVILVILLLIVGCFYVLRRSRKEAP
jgi:hypothetical protein